MICPICGHTITAQRPKEFIKCPYCQHVIDPDDLEESE